MTMHSLLRFFKQRDDNTDDEEALEMNMFWHRRLAAYFEHCNNIDRKAEVNFLFYLTWNTLIMAC